MFRIRAFEEMMGSARARLRSREARAHAIRDRQDSKKVSMQQEQGVGSRGVAGPVVFSGAHVRAHVLPLST